MTFLEFWSALNDALTARRIAHARYREAKDFWDFGDRDPQRVASTWSADTATELDV
jgi:hypothetical protein